MKVKLEKEIIKTDFLIIGGGIAGFGYVTQNAAQKL